MKVSPEDSDLLDWCWGPDKDGYFRRGNSPRHAHRIIAARILGRDLTRGECVDHINHDRADNQRANLRVVSVSENGRNRSGGYGESRYIGVALHKKTRKWQAQIQSSIKSHYLGLFETQEEAARAYNQAAERMGYLSHNTL